MQPRETVLTRRSQRISNASLYTVKRQSEDVMEHSTAEQLSKLQKGVHPVSDTKYNSERNISGIKGRERNILETGGKVRIIKYSFAQHNFILQNPTTMGTASDDG